MKISQVIILAGGFGKRLGSITKRTPKPLIKINGVPFLFYLIKKIEKAGFKKIIILTYYKNHLFENFIKKIKIKKLEIILHKEPRPLGTLKSIQNSLKYLDDNFIVINGDTFFNLDFKKLRNINEKKRYENVIYLTKSSSYLSNKKLSNIKIKKKKIIFSKSKIANLMNAGVYILKKKYFIKNLKYSSLEEYISSYLIPKNKIYGIKSKAKFIDIGTKKNLNKAKLILPENLTY